MKKRILSLVLAVLMLMGTVSIPVVYAKDDLFEVTNAKEYASSSSEKEDLTQYVNMRYGTGTVSQCIIGPARPNGSVHPGPDTFPTNNYTGYYPSKPIRGFSQMHIQAGEGRFGQFLISPQVGLSVALDSHDSDKTNENPTATEYSVTLSKYDIDVALTPTENAVIYKFTYPTATDENTEASILLDMIHHVPVYNEANDRVYNKQAKDVDITIEQDENGNTVLFGGAKYGAHGSSDRYYYFYAVIESASLENKTIGVYKQGEIVEGATSIDTEASTVVDPTFLGTGAYLNFDLDNEAETTVLMKIGVSFLSTDKAKASLENEIPAWNYDKVKSDNNAIWNDKLDVMEVSGLTEDQKEMFYTNLYDTFLQPRYRTGELAEYGDGMILDDHVATWDTFRTLFPLLTITNPKLITDMVESYVVRFEDKETGSADNAKAVKDIFTCFERISGNQGGDNIDNVIAEAYVKGLIPEEMMDAVYELVEFEATMMRTDRVKADQTSGSLTSTYKDLGYIPADVYPMMNCNTQLEYCYNDYCLAQIALGEGDTELYNMLMERSASWLNIWNDDAEGDKFTGFIWPKNSDGSFVEPNSDLTSATKRIGSWKPYFYEGTAYEYSFFVPHDIPTLMEKMGGEAEFIERLQVGIDSGYIKIDNQPGYIQAFLFNYTSEPWHTSDYVDKLIKKYTINGTPGNDDSGASCAWYIFANIGFFPSAGQDIYWLTSPKYEQTKINLDNGKTFTIKANNLSDTNKYIQAVYLNGEQLKNTMITHSDIVSGGTLVYEMGSTPVDYSSVTVVNGSVANGNYEWSLNSKGVLTISGTGDRTLRFDNVITAESISDIPWYSVRDDIKKVIISEETGITSLCAYALSNLPSCEAIIIPTTLTDLSASRIFEKNTALASIGTIEEFVKGEFILENITAFGSDIFADSSDGITVLLSICKGEFAPAKWFTNNTTVNFFINGNQPAVTWANNIKNGIEDTRADGYKFKIGSVEAIIGGEENVGNLYSWLLDTTTGTLTFKNLKTDGSWNELSFSSTATAFSEWVIDYKDEIKHIVIPKFNKFSCTAASPFANLKNLETVKMDTVRWSSGTSTNAIFANCTALTTFGTSKNFEVGKVKLEGLECEFLASKYPQNIFKGCTAITSVDFTGMLRYSDAVNTQIELAIGANILSGCTSLREIIFGETVVIDSNAFGGCTALEAITIPETVTSIASNAFAGCNSLTNVTIETENYTDGLMTDTSFPDKAGLIIYCQNWDMANAINSIGYTYTKAVNANVTVSSGIKMEGFSIRTEGYNGLRGIFSIDNASIAANETNGLTLVEYGGIVTTKANKDAYGTELTKIEEGFVTANSRVIKAPVWSNGKFVGSYLSKTSSETKFAVTIVKYSNNYTTDICMIGYSIWQDAAGNLYYSYVDCENDAFDATSIYDVTLGMYKDGVVNAANDPDGVIWNTLVSGGAVILTAGTDYNNSAIYYEADGTTAKSFGNTFLALDVPCVSQSVSGTTFTCSNIGSTYSLFEDGDNYVIIFRAGTSGTNPKALPNATGSEWGTMYQLQHSGSFAPSATKIVNAPNPVFTSTAASKITYAIIDSGIEKIQRSTFYGNKQIKTIVYPDTLSSIERWAFNGSAITTMFKAGDIAEEGKLDLANYSGSIDMYALFRNAKNYKKVCLPATITNLGGISFAASNVTKIWISGNPEPKYDGIVDLTGANISTGDSSLQEVKNVNLVMLHDNATLHKTRTLDKMNSNGVTVWTKNHSEAIATEIQNIKNGVVYKMNVDYIVGDEALASYLATKYGS